MVTGKAKPHRATGSAAIASSLSPETPIVLVSVRMHLSAAGGTASENFTVTIDSATAAAYDTVIFSQDMNTVQDLLWVPEQPVPVVNGDEIDFAWANANGRTYGLEAVYRKEG